MRLVCTVCGKKTTSKAADVCMACKNAAVLATIRPFCLDRLDTDIRLDVRSSRLRVECSGCKTPFTITPSYILRQLKKHPYLTCSGCELSRNAMARFLGVYSDVLVGPPPAGLTAKDQATVCCRNCNVVFTVSALWLVLRRRHKFSGWCRECVQRTSEVRASISLVQKGRPGRPKTIAQRLALSDSAKAAWQKPEARAKYMRSLSLKSYPKTRNSAERDIRDWVGSLGLTAQKEVIAGREVDVVVSSGPSRLLGIEYCGLYWHSDSAPVPRGPDYHLDKKIAVESEHLTVTVFEDEWKKTPWLVQSLLKKNLGLLPKVDVRLGLPVEPRNKTLQTFLRTCRVRSNADLAYSRVYSLTDTCGESIEGYLLCGLDIAELVEPLDQSLCLADSPLPLRQDLRWGPGRVVLGPAPARKNGRRGGWPVDTPKSYLVWDCGYSVVDPVVSR